MTRRILTTALTLSALAIASSAEAQQTRSGLLLGIYAQPAGSGLGVRGFIPGYSAENVLRANDVIMRATTDGVTVLPTRTLYEIENVKSRFGSNVDVALEVFRPGVGYEYCWVTFTPTGASPAAGAPATATFKSEAVKPGARSLFNRGGGVSRPMPMPRTGTNPVPNPSPRPSAGGGSAKNLFGRP